MDISHTFDQAPPLVGDRQGGAISQSPSPPRRQPRDFPGVSAEGNRRLRRSPGGRLGNRPSLAIADQWQLGRERAAAIKRSIPSGIRRVHPGKRANLGDFTLESRTGKGFYRSSGEHARRRVEPRGRLVRPPGFLVATRGRLIGPSGCLLRSRGRLVRKSGRLGVTRGRLPTFRGCLAIIQDGRLGDGARASGGARVPLPSSGCVVETRYSLP